MTFLWEKNTLTYLMEEFRQLYFHLLSLEHVIFSLLTDRRDQVKLSRHRVRFLKKTYNNTVK